MLRSVLIAVLFLNCNLSFSQGPVWELHSKDSIRHYIYVLASDSLQGRETGRPGQKKAAEYITFLYKNWNVQPAPGGYLIDHPIFKKAEPKFTLSINDTRFTYLDDFYYLPVKNTTLFVPKIVFYKSLKKPVKGDLSATTVMIIDPESQYLKTRFALKKTNTLNEQLKLAAENPPAILMIVTTQVDERAISLDDTILKQLRELSFPVLFTDTNVARAFSSVIMDEPKKADGIQIATDHNVGLIRDTSMLTGQNILAMIEGTDKKDEYVFLSAHYDHIGMLHNEIHPGADDNGTGTSVVLEFARIMSVAAKNGIRPRRNIVFANFSGEEKGLLGSTWYVNHLPISANKIYVDINIDMVGRHDTDHTNNQRYIYLIGSDDKLTETFYKKVNEINDSCCGLIIDRSLDGEKAPGQYYRRSDHYSFIKKGIPAIFFFSGVHQDYHQPGDTADKINFDLLEERARLFFYVLWDMAY